MKVLQAKPLVEDLLKTRPELRDDDRALIATIWKTAAEKKYGYSTQALCARAFLEDYAKGYYPSAESIRRSRAKLQQDHPELRGEKYEERHKVREPEVREDLREDTAGSQSPKKSEFEKAIEESIDRNKVSEAARTLSRAKKSKLKMREAMDPGDQGVGQTSLFKENQNEKE